MIIELKARNIQIAIPMSAIQYIALHNIHDPNGSGRILYIEISTITSTIQFNRSAVGSLKIDYDVLVKHIADNVKICIDDLAAISTKIRS